jgi:hypothetical protein
MSLRRHNLHDGALMAQVVCAVITGRLKGKVMAHLVPSLTAH